MKNILIHNKNGVSEIVSYVILVIIAISIGGLVFVYLSNLVPKDRPECREGLSISIEDTICLYNPIGNSSLDIYLRNTGRFNIEAAYIRIGNIGNKTAHWINSADFNFKGVLNTNSPEVLKKYSFKTQEVLKYGPGNYTLEIQIAGYDKETNKYAACPNSIITTISCSS